MSTTATEFDFGPALRREAKIDAAEGEAILERWEVGRELIAMVERRARLKRHIDWALGVGESDVREAS